MGLERCGHLCPECDEDIDYPSLRREAEEVGESLARICEANDLDSALAAVLRIQASRLIAASASALLRQSVDKP